MHMLSVGATGEERAKAVFSGLLAGSIGLAVAAFGFVFARAFYPRDYFPRSLFQDDSPDAGSFPDLGPAGFESSVSYSSELESPVFGFDGTGSDGMDLAFALVGLFFFAFGTLWAVSFFGMIARTFRAAAWLDGTRAHVRGVFRTHSVDLATAYVYQGAITTRIGHRVISTPTLEARDPATGAKLTIRLEGLGSGRLPPNELRALADAMSRGRGDSDNDRDVLDLAENLRAAKL
jgi:hypothetical protein